MQMQFKEMKANLAQSEREAEQTYELIADQKQQIKDLRDTIDELKRSLSFVSVEGQEKDRQIALLIEENSTLKECQEHNAKLLLHNGNLMAGQDIFISQRSFAIEVAEKAKLTQELKDIKAEVLHYKATEIKNIEALQESRVISQLQAQESQHVL